MKKLLFLTMALVALALPSISSACHVVEVVGDANCNGWSLCATVFFTDTVDEGSLAYTVAVMDGNGDEVMTMGETLMITHEPGEGEFEFCFEGIWEGEYEVADATVVITSTLDDGEPAVFTFDLDCALADDTATLGSLKAQYR